MQNARKPIVVVGSINFDLVTRAGRIPLAGETVLGEELQMHPGGKGANQAVAIARLGYPVQMIGKIGSDVFGEQLRDHLAASGVDLSGVETTGGASGVALIVVGPRGENSIVVTPGANAQVSPEYVDQHAELLRGASLVLTQLEIPLETVVRLAELCQRHDIPLMLDPAPARELPSSLLERIHWFTPNETEASFYSPGVNGHQEPKIIARTLLAKGPRGVLLKMGSRGAFLATNNLELQFKAIKVQPLDTTAAGDAFNGAFAVGLQLGRSPAESARFAVVAAAISVVRPGAQPSMPTMEEVDRLLQQQASENSGGKERTIV